MKKAAAFLLLLPLLVYGRNLNSPAPTPQQMGEDASANITVGEAWNHIANNGDLGGDWGDGTYGYDWPGGGPHNYYLWGSYFTLGAKVGGFYYVTYANYPVTNGEWAPSFEPIQEGPGKSAYDVEVVLQDLASSNPRNNNGRHLGVKVIIHTLAWPHEPYNNFIAHEIYITYNQSECDIPDAGPVLDSVFLGMWYDADVCGGDPSDPHIDDLVYFDGWTNGEWNNPNFQFPSPIDTLTILPDTVLAQPDGIYDQYFVWGDEPDEHLAYDGADAWEIQRGDETILGYVIPRGMSVIYDGDNPADPGDDTGENGKCMGYIGGAFVYAPPAPADSQWMGTSGNDCRIVRPWSHQWWNWESDPATDVDVYNYLVGRHPATAGYRYAPHPYDLGASEFDYRFLNTVGPYQLADGDTLKFVWIVGVGQGLNGGPDNYWRGGKWMQGLRQVLEAAYKAYYAGSQHSDPAHPSAPDEDVHWSIPVPPNPPALIYSSTDRGIELVWDDAPEKTPDPIKGYVDFSHYRVYRALYTPQNWQLLTEIHRNPDGSFNHTYLDSTASPGFPYYYVVTSVDEDTLESSKSNYLTDAEGNPRAITMVTSPSDDLDKIRVVPNPYLGSAPWTATEIADKVEFQNLPRSCKIYIYTLAGDLVRVLNHTSGTGSEAWNLLNESGEKVVSGPYIYKVETPDGRYKIGKFLILK